MTYKKKKDEYYKQIDDLILRSSSTKTTKKYQSINRRKKGSALIDNNFPNIEKLKERVNARNSHPNANHSYNLIKIKVFNSDEDEIFTTNGGSSWLGRISSRLFLIIAFISLYLSTIWRYFLGMMNFIYNFTGIKLFYEWSKLSRSKEVIRYLSKGISVIISKTLSRSKSTISAMRDEISSWSTGIKVCSGMVKTGLAIIWLLTRPIYLIYYINDKVVAKVKLSLRTRKRRSKNHKNSKLIYQMLVVLFFFFIIFTSSTIWTQTSDTPLGMKITDYQDPSGGFTGLDIESMNVTLENSYYAVMLLKSDGYFDTPNDVPEGFNISSIVDFVLDCYVPNKGFKNTPNESEKTLDYSLNITYMGVKILEVLNALDIRDGFKADVRKTLNSYWSNAYTTLSSACKANNVEMLYHVVKIFKILNSSWIETDLGLEIYGIKNIKVYDTNNTGSTRSGTGPVDRWDQVFSDLQYPVEAPIEAIKNFGKDQRKLETHEPEPVSITKSLITGSNRQILKWDQVYFDNSLIYQMNLTDISGVIGLLAEIVDSTISNKIISLIWDKDVFVDQIKTLYNLEAILEYQDYQTLWQIVDANSYLNWMSSDELDRISDAITFNNWHIVENTKFYEEVENIKEQLLRGILVEQLQFASQEDIPPIDSLKLTYYGKEILATLGELKSDNIILQAVKDESNNIIGFNKTEIVQSINLVPTPDNLWFMITISLIILISIPSLVYGSSKLGKKWTIRCMSILLMIIMLGSSFFPIIQMAETSKDLPYQSKEVEERPPYIEKHGSPRVLDSDPTESSYLTAFNKWKSNSSQIQPSWREQFGLSSPGSIGTPYTPESAKWDEQIFIEKESLKVDTGLKRLEIAKGLNMEVSRFSEIVRLFLKFDSHDFYLKDLDFLKHGDLALDFKGLIREEIDKKISNEARNMRNHINHLINHNNGLKGLIKKISNAQNKGERDGYLNKFYTKIEKGLKSQIKKATKEQELTIKRTILLVNTIRACQKANILHNVGPQTKIIVDEYGKYEKWRVLIVDTSLKKIISVREGVDLDEVAKDEFFKWYLRIEKNEMKDGLVEKGFSSEEIDTFELKEVTIKGKRSDIFDFPRYLEDEIGKARLPGIQSDKEYWGAVDYPDYSSQIMYVVGIGFRVLKDTFYQDGTGDFEGIKDILISIIAEKLDETFNREGELTNLIIGDLETRYPDKVGEWIRDGKIDCKKILQHVFKYFDPAKSEEIYKGIKDITKVNTDIMGEKFSSEWDKLPEEFRIKIYNELFSIGKEFLNGRLADYTPGEKGLWEKYAEDLMDLKKYKRIYDFPEIIGEYILGRVNVDELGYDEMKVMFQNEGTAKRIKILSVLDNKESNECFENFNFRLFYQKMTSEKIVDPHIKAFYEAIGSGKLFDDPNEKIKIIKESSEEDITVGELIDKVLRKKVAKKVLKHSYP